MTANEELDVEAIRENIQLYDLDDGGDTPAQGDYTDSDLAVRDIRRLLDKVDSLLVHNGVLVTEIRFQAERADKAARERDERSSSRDLLVAEEKLRSADIEQRKLLARIAVLEELKCAVCGRRVAHLNCNGHVIGWGCADGEECKPAPEMPRPPAEEAPTEEERADLIVALLFGDPEATNGTAQPGAGDTETAGSGSGRGTGVAEASGTAQAREEWGVRRRDGRVLSFEDRDDAEAFADGWHGGERTVIHRFIGPWEPAPSLPVPSTERPAQ